MRARSSRRPARGAGRADRPRSRARSPRRRGSHRSGPFARAVTRGVCDRRARPAWSRRAVAGSLGGRTRHAHRRDTRRRETERTTNRHRDPAAFGWRSPLFRVVRSFIDAASPRSASLPANAGASLGYRRCERSQPWPHPTRIPALRRRPEWGIRPEVGAPSKAAARGVRLRVTSTPPGVRVTHARRFALDGHDDADAFRTSVTTTMAQRGGPAAPTDSPAERSRRGPPRPGVGSLQTGVDGARRPPELHRVIAVEQRSACGIAAPAAVTHRAARRRA